MRMFSAFDKDIVFGNIIINDKKDYMLYLDLLVIYLNNPLWLIELQDTARAIASKAQNAIDEQLIRESMREMLNI